MKKFIPILDWLPNYSKSNFKKDLPAGLTVGIILIPQGMAYAMIAGLPPVMGLYAALIPQVIYAILGTSRQLSVGPVAMDSLLVASGLGALKLAGIEEYMAMAVFLALFMGSIQFLLGVLRMGFLVNFLSKPVISGFTSAAALIIGFSQLKHLLGVDIERSNRFHEVVQNTIPELTHTNLITLSIGLGGIIIIMLLKKWKKSFPGTLLVVVGAILLMYLTGLDQSGVQIAGDIPQGLPSFNIPSVSQQQVLDIAPIAIALALVAFMEAISVSKAIEDKHDDYTVDPNQELRALGASNMIGALFQSYPTTGGFSRSAINDQTGAKTGMSSIISAVVIGLTLLFLTPLFYYLPKPILASVVMVAVFGLIDFKYPLQLIKNRRDEFVALLLTFFITLFVGIVIGIVVGMIFSLLLLVHRTAKPHIAELGRIAGTNYFKNIARFSSEIEEREDLLLLRFDSQLYFGNTDYFKSELIKRIEKKKGVLRAVILNAESISYIDSTASIMLLQMIKDLKKEGISLMITGAIGPTRDILYKCGIIEELGKENLFVKTHEAVDYIDRGISKSDMQKIIVRQTKK